MRWYSVIIELASEVGGNTKMVSRNRKQSDEVDLGPGKFADVTFASDGGEEKAKRSRNYLHQNMTDKSIMKQTEFEQTKEEERLEGKRRLRVEATHLQQSRVKTAKAEKRRKEEIKKSMRRKRKEWMKLWLKHEEGMPAESESQKSEELRILKQKELQVKSMESKFKEYYKVLRKSQKSRKSPKVLRMQALSSKLEESKASFNNQNLQ